MKGRSYVEQALFLGRLSYRRVLDSAYKGTADRSPWWGVGTILARVGNPDPRCPRRVRNMPVVELLVRARGEQQPGLACRCELLQWPLAELRAGLLGAQRCSAAPSL